MNSQRTGLRVAAVIFAIFAVLHIIRLFKHVKVSFDTFHVPMGFSWIALIVAGLLSIWLWRLSSGK